MTLLEVEGIHSYYGSIEALRGVSLEVEAGEVVTMIGSNGAGKSTTLRSISGLVPPRSGSIRLDGVEIAAVPPSRIVALGISHAPEGRRCFPRMTVRENLELGAYRRRDTDVPRDIERVFGLFSRLREREGQKAGTMSGGEQQMLAIGRALMSKPRLLLIDEASLGLSPALAKIVFQVVNRINEDGVTVVIVEQNVGVLPYADRALIMEKGTLIFSGVGEEIRSANLRETYLGGGDE